MAAKKRTQASENRNVGSGNEEVISACIPPTIQLSIEQIDSFSGPDFMTSLARGLLLLQAFCNTKRPPSISQLSTKTGLSRAAVRRGLYTLTCLGFASTDDSQHFVLLPQVLSLGYGYLSSTPFGHAARPLLEKLGRSLRESCSISVLTGSEIVYIARAKVTRIMSVDLSVGSRLPAFCTSMGRVLLAGLPEEEWDRHLVNTELQKRTSRTITSPDKLKQILRSVRKNGFCIVDQELEEGLRAIAVPVKNPSGTVVAALNAGTQVQRVSIEELQTHFLPELSDAAQQLSMLC